MALPAGRKGVLPSELTPEGKIKNSSSPYVLPTASAETLGGVKVGSGLSIADGVLSANGYSLPTASAETLGGVKVGSGLSIEDGVLSASGGGKTIYTYEYSLSNVSFTSLQIMGNYDNVALTSIPANAVIISAMMLPTGGNNPQFIYPLLGRDTNGAVHLGFGNMLDNTCSFTGKLIIKYYLEEA